MFSSSEVIRHRERGAPVDCHVLHFGEPEHYLDQCLASLEDAPVNVLILRGGFPGNIGAARAYAVALGHAPYWAFVDADDVLLPGAVSACTAALDGEPRLVGVYTDYEAISPDGALLYRTKKSCWSPLALLNSCWEVLHYHQYRREFVGRHLDGLARCPCYEEAYLAGILSQYGDFRRLDLCGYRKRDAGQSSRLQDALLLRRIYRDITPALLQAHRRWTAMKRAA